MQEILWEIHLSRSQDFVAPLYEIFEEALTYVSDERWFLDIGLALDNTMVR